MNHLKAPEIAWNHWKNFMNCIKGCKTQIMKTKILRQNT